MTHAVPEKKRHHYVPVSYLEAFCDSGGCLRVFRKDAPGRSLRMAPRSIGFRNQYYSQPTPSGTVDNNALEDLFSEVAESKWKQLLTQLQAGADVGPDGVEALFTVMALQKVRVPASRDATEARLAQPVGQLLQQMHAEGRLPPLPRELGDNLDLVRVAIDPQESIHGMLHELLSTVLEVMDRVGLILVHNDTGTPFVTSDNPVVWFDPTRQGPDEQPYDIKPDGPVMLMFPLSPTLLLMGSDEHKETFNQHGLLRAAAPDTPWVTRSNEQICRYAYEAVFASDLSQAALICHHEALSPVFNPVDPGGPLLFGKRQPLPKWGKS